MWGAWAGFTAAVEAGCPERDLSLWPSSQVIPVPETKCQMEWFSGHGDGLTAQSISRQLTSLQLHQLVGEKNINIYNHIWQIFPTLGPLPVYAGIPACFRWTLSSYFWVLLRVCSLIAQKSLSCLECVEVNEVHSFKERECGLSLFEAGCSLQQLGSLFDTIFHTLMVFVLLLLFIALELCLPMDHSAYICPLSLEHWHPNCLCSWQNILFFFASTSFRRNPRSENCRALASLFQPSSQGSFLCYPNRYPNIHKLLGIKRCTLLSLLSNFPSTRPSSKVWMDTKLTSGAGVRLPTHSLNV